MGVQAYRAASALIPLLKDDVADVRYKTAWALGMIGEEVAVEPLIEALLDKNGNVKSAAAHSLSNLTGESFGKDHDRWKEWFEENK